MISHRAYHIRQVNCARRLRRLALLIKEKENEKEFDSQITEQFHAQGAGYSNRYFARLERRLSQVGQPTSRSNNPRRPVDIRCLDAREKVAGAGYLLYNGQRWFPDTRETELMSTKKTPTPTFLLALCIACVLSFHGRVNAARNHVTDRKDSDAQQSLTQGDSYFDRSQYREAQKQYEQAIALGAKNGDKVVEARALSRLARVSSYSGNNDVAQQHLNKAFALLLEAGDDPAAKNAHGETLAVEGELLQAKGNFKKALTKLEEALGFLDGNQDAQARVDLFIGYINGSIGNNDRAEVEILWALKLYEGTNNKLGVGQALSALGLLHSAKGDNDSAINLHKSALDIFHTVGDRHSEGIANNALGQAYEALNEPKLALDHYEQALRLFEAAGAMNGIGPTNCLVAHVHLTGNRLEQALTFYQRCLNLSHNAGMVRHEIIALTQIASVYASQQRFDLALPQHLRVQKFYESIGDRRGLARALVGYGDLWIQAGQKQRALDAYQQALDLSEQVGEQNTQLMALYGLAHTNFVNGAPDDALRFIQRSLKLIEALRANVASPEFRTSYFSGERQHYDLAIQILAQLHRLHPEQDFAAQALVVGELSRARLLLDLVTQSSANIREGAAKELLDKERELRGLFRAQAEYRMNLGSNPKDTAEFTEVDGQLVQLKADYQRVEAQLRQQNPYLSSLEQFEPLSLEQIQKELPDDTILLEYALGDEHSYLLAVTHNSIDIHELTKRQLIEDSVRKLYESVTAQQGTDGQSTDEYRAKIAAAENAFPETARALSQILLGPVADKLGNKRLILVLEGALQYVPFAALPSPAAPESTTPLLVTNEIVREPSFSALVAIRKNIARHSSSPGKLVAVIADPVLNRSDDRVQHDPLSPATAVAEAQLDQPLTRDAGFTRLAHASEEADTISAAAPKGTTMIAKGFDANRETVMSANVGQFQIVHFATHGVLNSEHPELSAIVLTMVDHNGAPTDGLMSLHDIYSLDLSAQLTVLSACQTALGKDIRGEGMVGLNHAFMSAGSKSVVSSLWKVDDRATADLMREFYQSMLQEGMSPAAALRSAQRKMMEKNGTSAPYYWAGFVIQGEYTNRIAIDDRSSYRMALALLVGLSLVTAGAVFWLKRKRRTSPAQSNGTEQNA